MIGSLTWFENTPYSGELDRHYDVTAWKLDNGNVALVVSNITERKRAEAALRASETKYRRLYESLQDAVVSVDMKGRIFEFNSAYARMLGYRPEELRRMNYAELTPRKWHRLDARIVREQILPHGHSGIYEEEYRRKDGSIFPVELRRFLIRDERGKPQAMWAIVRDITERKRADALLREANSNLEQRVAARTGELTESLGRLRAVMDTKLVGIVTIDERGIILTANGGITQMFGYSPAELVGRNLSLLMPPPDRPNRDAARGRNRAGGKKQILGAPREVVAHRKNGEEFAVELDVAEFRSGGSRFFAGILRDVSQRRRLEAEVTHAYEEAHRDLAVELHDGLGQHLHGMKYLAEQLCRRLTQAGSPEADEVRRQLQLLDQAIEQARRMARGLRPLEDVPEGLMFSLRELAQELDAAGKAKVRLHCPRPVLVSGNLVASHLFRIAQEAASNALQHAKCTTIELHLTVAQGRIVLAVRDNGAGIRRHLHPGIGLHVMQYRADAIHGALTVHSGPGRGTEVVCTVPLSAAPPNG